MQRRQWEVKTIEPRKIIARKQRKISQVFPSRMTPDLTQESQWNQTYHRPFSTSKICMNVSEHLTLHNGSLIKFFSGNSFVRPNVSAILLVELKRLAFDVFIFAQIHTINHTTTAFRSSDTTNDAEVMFWLKTSSIFAVFANHFFTSKNQTPLLLSVNSSGVKFSFKISLKNPARWCNSRCSLVKKHQVSFFSRGARTYGTVWEHRNTRVSICRKICENFCNIYDQRVT